MGTPVGTEQWFCGCGQEVVKIDLRSGPYAPPDPPYTAWIHVVPRLASSHAAYGVRRVKRIVKRRRTW